MAKFNFFTTTEFNKEFKRLAKKYKSLSSDLLEFKEEFDNNPTQFQVAERFISDTEIKEELELFLQEGYNRLRFLKNLDKYIKNVVELGYLKEISKKDNETKYQIQRIIKEKITLDILQEFKIKLQDYVKSI